MNSQTDNWIEAALQELAAADAGAVVRPEIEVAVLHAWEARHAAARSDRPNRMAFVLGWRKMAAWMAVPAAGAAVAVSALLVERRSAPTDRGFSATIHARPPAGISPVVVLPPARSNDLRQAPRTPRRFASERRPMREVEYVIVPEPFADPDALHVVHVRMPRTTLATLGMPIGDPDARGLVDVEMLVGDDGVARSIRNATFAREPTEGVRR
jgi:hypothetical protein